ncbi:kinase-like protein [Lophiostoma macrostomum CBS 122681]|uniref:Kinase-like protein n=1 Tax=Lophiostoma macrostomum CBS 122681 TaxID=1314788 RepID=A0A6A6TPL4_9PLEO|nr:kinase-like protein [Lophiostoma macrostomum CBS 122681]
MARTIRGSEVSTELSERHANDSQGKTSLSSTFHRNRYDARDHIFASARDNFSRPPQPGNAHYPTPDTLTILNLLSYFKICIFPADTHIFHYDTRQLGKGSTFRVQAASLPVWRARAHFRYRDPTFPRQGEKFLFTDHTQTKWKRSTIGAWKLLVHEPDLEESRDRLMGDLIKELRILSHPPLQLHPNIVHVLGFVWLQDRQFFTDDPKSDFNDARLREWPTVVTERAPHGSLREFMSDPSHTVPPTLRTKLLHCADIINGVKALHDCDIVHGDMKCDNVLIYEDSRPDTAENWQAKIADFSHSVVLNESASSDIKSSVDEAIRGTNLYHAPEISADRQVENWHNLNTLGSMRSSLKIEVPTGPAIDRGSVGTSRKLPVTNPNGKA